MFISMHSILGWASFCMNYCIDAAWNEVNQSVSLLRCNGSPGCFDSGLQLICIFWSLASHFSLYKTPQILYEIQVWWVCWPIKHTNTMVIEPAFGTFGTVCRWQILLENEISIFKKLVSRRKHEVLHNFLVNRCRDFKKTQWTNTNRWHCTPNHHRLRKLNTGLQATWAMSFSTLPPDSGTLVSKWNTKLALFWKEDFGPLGNSPVLLLCPGKTTTVAKFLDTSVCGGSWCLDPSLSPFLVKVTQILESIFLDNPHKAAVLSVGCASFSSTLFPSTQLSVNMLWYCTLWTASLAMNVCGLPSLWRVSMIVFWTTVRSAVFPMIV